MSGETYKGWAIDVDPVIGKVWFATSPNYDASWEGEEDGWVDNGEKVEANSYDALLEAIDDYLAEAIHD